MATAVKKPAAKKTPAAKKPVAPKATKETAPTAPKEDTASAGTPELKRVGGAILTFHTEKLPCPPRSRTGGGTSSYPLAQVVETGKGFSLTPDVDKDLYTSDTEYQNAIKESRRAIQNRLSGAVRRYMKTHPDANLAVRVLKDGSVNVYVVDAE